MQSSGQLGVDMAALQQLRDDLGNFPVARDRYEAIRNPWGPGHATSCTIGRHDCRFLRARGEEHRLLTPHPTAGSMGTHAG